MDYFGILRRKKGKHLDFLEFSSYNVKQEEEYMFNTLGLNNEWETDDEHTSLIYYN